MRRDRAPRWVWHRAARLLAVCALMVLMAGCATQARFEPLLPGIALDRAAGVVRVDGAFCLRSGILEYVAVSAGGKEYESLLRLHCRPSHLQQALLMAGYEIGEVPAPARGDYVGVDPNVPADRPPAAPTPAAPPESYWARAASGGTQVRIDVAVWREDGSWQRADVVRFLVDRRTGAAPTGLRWVFTGSYFDPDVPLGQPTFAADQTRSVIGLWYDPTAILNLTVDIGNPYRGAQRGVAVDEEEVPPADTPARIFILMAEE